MEKKFSGPRSNSGWYIVFSWHVSLMSFNLEQFLSVCVCPCFINLASLKRNAGYFVEFSSIWICYSFMIQVRFYIFSRNGSEVMQCSLHCILPEDTWGQFVPLLVMFIWLMWDLPGLSTINWICNWKGNTLRLHKYPVFIKRPSTCFCIYRWFLPESITTMNVVKWWYFKLCYSFNIY